MLSQHSRPGATYLGDDRCHFLVWAPHASSVQVHITAPVERLEPLVRDYRGYHRIELDSVPPGTLYSYRLDGGPDLPDPASRYQPDGVHGPSQVIDPHAYTWNDDTWRGIAQHDLVIYELHVGTFSDEGTFDGVIPYLDELKALGITAIKVLPVNAFSGERNWGYDGVLPFAVQHSYGDPDAMRRLVDACHQRGLAVLLDVVYNHLGPEGNYLSEFGPYFTNQHLTPWGQAINYDGNHSDHVREFFIQNGLYWLSEYHLDGFRLDAIHAIYDQTSRPFLEEWTAAVHRRGDELGRRPVVIAESMMNDPKVLLPAALGGFDMDAEWNDDFHHALHVLLTGERDGYYKDYCGIGDLARAFRQGYVYTGEYMSYRGRRHGRMPYNTEPRQFLAYSQTHDQVGNHAGCARMSQLTTYEGLKVAAGATLLSPFVPMLFMGEEYGETNPWWYFVDHQDPELREAVRKGRQQEFAGFNWSGEMADPDSEEAFEQSRLQHHLKDTAGHRELLEWYRELLGLRRSVPALKTMSFEQQEVVPYEVEKTLLLRRWSGESEVCVLFSFASETVDLRVRLAEGQWTKLLDSSESRWLGDDVSIPNSVQSTGVVDITLGPFTCVLLERVQEDI